MSGKIKRGRPVAGGDADTLRIIHVGLDEDANAALKQLEAALGAGVRRGRTSIAVRRALLFAADAHRKR